MRAVAIDQTRREIRVTFRRWDIDPSEFEIIYDEEIDGRRVIRRPGATVRYLRAGAWQSVACFGFPTRSENLRQCFFLLDRLRIAEQHGVQYQGLTYTTDVATTDKAAARKESLLDAYDILGASPDDPVDLIRDVYRRKSMYYHPDKSGGNVDKFKKLTEAYNLILKSRGQS